MPAKVLRQIRSVRPFETVKPEQPQEMQAVRTKKAMGLAMQAALKRARLRPKFGPLVPSQSIQAALPQAMAPDGGLGARWEFGTAPGRHDTVQTPAMPPDRCAGRFPAAWEAGKAVVRQAERLRAPLQEEVD